MFPYYIVRFKRNGAVLCSKEGITRFHTTQYDLNYQRVVGARRRVYSFHTTQYDLNFLILCYYDFKYRFPYYIVRFKPKNMKNKQHNICPFPYYIVRFKHYWGFSVAVEISGFHTTQYDLNYSTQSFIPTREARFHTTQYDLNTNPMILFGLGILGFHTTQYDLNNTRETVKRQFETVFPYYIVRFKLVGSISAIEILKVSILHSTI